MSYQPKNANGSATSANSAPVVIASDQTAIPVTNATGATSAKQDTGNTSLASIDAKITAVNTGAVVVSSSALPTGAATAAKQPALGTAGTASADVITVQGKTSMTPLLVDPSGVTSPVSLASVPSHAVTNAGTFAVQASAGTNLNTSALALDATLTGGAQVAIAKGAAASGASKSGNPVQTGGVFNTTQPTVTTGQAVESQSTARGATIVSPGVDNFAVQATLNTETTKIIGAVNNLPATVDTNSGVKSASTLRIVLATDQPALTNKLLVTPDSVALPANQSVNNAQVNGVTPLMGNGVTGTGSQRVTIASDNTAFSVNAVESGTWTVGANSATGAAIPANVFAIGAQDGNNQLHSLYTANKFSDADTGGNSLEVHNRLYNGSTFDRMRSASGAPTGTLAVTDQPTTSGGLSIITGSVGATATAIKASAGQLYGYHLFNTTAAVAYVQVFNVAFGSVTLGTTAPTMSIGIPAGGGATVNFDKGIAFGTAISFACTTTRTGLTGATCDVNFLYK